MIDRLEKESADLAKEKEELEEQLDRQCDTPRVRALVDRLEAKAPGTQDRSLAEITAFLAHIQDVLAEIEQDCIRV